MKIKFERYTSVKDSWPKEGRHILGHQQGDEMVVYQAYKPSIADYAVEHQELGGSEFSYNRMSWIKPNFLWMMFRCGWAEKKDQERVLAIWIKQASFEHIVSHAVVSSFDKMYYTDHEIWRDEMDRKEVRMQWDPDHDPFGNKLVRRAIQLGIKGDMLRNFGRQDICKIEDVTEFVKTQKGFLDIGRLDLLEVPKETVWMPADEAVRKKIGIDSL